MIHYKTQNYVENECAKCEAGDDNTEREMTEMSPTAGRTGENISSYNL